MPAVSASRASNLDATCYGCIHNRYRGPHELRDLVNGKTVIPLHADERLAPGRYVCAKFDAVIGPADQTPEPLEENAACKEVL